MSDQTSMWDAITQRQTGILGFTPELNAAIGRTRVAVFGCGGNGAAVEQQPQLTKYADSKCLW